MAGRRPKPGQLKVVAGNPGKRKINDKGPAPPFCAYFWTALSRCISRCAAGVIVPDDKGKYEFVI